MKNTRTFKFLSVGLFLFLLSGVFSCQDQFSEKDALSAQQQVDLLIYVIDLSTTTNDPVANATVSISQANQSYEITTDAKGIASFPKMIIGDYVYTIKAANFTTVTGIGQMNLLKFRQAEVTNTYGVYSLNSTQMATIKGNVIMETNLTNLSAEPSANSDVFVDVFLNGGNMTFLAKTDASGNYSIKIPTDGTNPNSTCTQVRMRYPDLEKDQTIAYNKLASDLLTFPTVRPKVDNAMKTVFSMDNQFLLNDFVPTSVRTVYGIADPAPANGTTAVVNSVTVNNQGQITGVSIANGSNYPGVNTVNITFTSLNGGSGATLTIDLAAAGTNNVRNAYNNGFFTLTQGSGYPQEYSLNGIGRRYSNYRNSFCIAPGSVNVANADYGTGVYKPLDVR